MFILLTCASEFNALQSEANLVGPLSLSSLSFLVAVLAIVLEFNKDAVVIPRRFYLELTWAVRILAGESIAWAVVAIIGTIPSGCGLSEVWILRTGRIALFVGVGLVAFLLAAMVREISAALRYRK